MSNSKTATDFDQIIQADRQRRKNEDLAKEIFGRPKTNDVHGKRDNKRVPKAPSLASRIGIAKRSSSASSVTSTRNLPVRPSSAAAQHARQNKLAEEIHNSQTTNVIIPRPSSGGLSIKGSAAPFVVEARNFAVGTSDADIASAIKQDCINSSGVNTLVSCKIVSARPTVVAELVFNERSMAENIIAKFHKQKADGQTLELRLARSGPGSMSKHHQQASTAQPNVTDTETPVTADDDDDDDLMVDLDTTSERQSTNTYDVKREEAERDRRHRDPRRDRDGDSPSKRLREDVRREDDRSQDDDRTRDRDRERNRDYSRSDRDERTTYQHAEGTGSRLSHYGNGVGGGPRPAYGGGYAGGRGHYTGYGGGYGTRGSYRGGFRGYR